mmetsp:Transcript_51463/g.122383  ORF Transcript_51463/g.122383 Transcript_51463/m.122383 type:complete len:1164 (+) Transcript_51463:71-3562(+)
MPSADPFGVLPVVKHKSTSSSINKVWSRGRAPVTVDFSPGEAKILEELLHISDTHVSIDTRIQELMKVTKELTQGLHRVQSQIKQLGAEGDEKLPERATSFREPTRAPSLPVVKAGESEAALPVDLARPSSPSQQNARHLMRRDSDPSIHNGRSSHRVTIEDPTMDRMERMDRQAEDPWHSLGGHSPHGHTPHGHSPHAPGSPRSPPSPQIHRPSLDYIAIARMMSNGQEPDLDTLLGAGWPSCIAAKRLAALNARRASMQEAPTLPRNRTEDIQVNMRKCRCCTWLRSGRLAINPNSWGRMLFDALSLLVLLWDLTVIPYLLAWDIKSGHGTIWQVVSWCTVSFWSIDIAVNCSTAIVEEGKLVKDPVIIFKRYFQSWFIPDFLIVLCDWSAMLITLVLDNASSGSLKMLRFAKLGRLLRIMGMLKVFKAARVVEEFLNRSVGETYRMSMKIISVIFCIIWMNHIICCGWFVVGRTATSDTGLHWLESSSLVEIAEQGLLFQYLTTFHWSLSQVTLGMTEVSAINSIEKMYTVSCLIFGLLFGSTLVSSLSATMVEFQMLRNGRQQKLRMLRQFLSDNSVDLDISYLVQKQVKERLNLSNRLTEQDVPVLNVLSSQLIAELRMEIYRAHLISHLLFNTWLGMDRQAFMALCSELSFTFLRPDDQLFNPGPADECCFFLISGPTLYRQTPDTSYVDEVEETPVKLKGWIAEAAMWSYWRHVGTVEARGSVQLLLLTVDALNEALQTRSPIRRVVQQYAEIFHRRIIEAKPPDGIYPTDIHIPLVNFEDIVMLMDKESQAAVGHVAIRHLKNTFAFGDMGHHALKSEVEKGKCNVILCQNGEVLRVVSVVAVRVENGLGQVLAQIGVYDDEKEEKSIKTECQLPGLKQNRAEEAKDAAYRCLQEKVPQLVHGVTVYGCNRITEMKPSKEFGVRTKYVKTVCHAVVDHESVDLQEWQAMNNLERYQLSQPRIDGGSVFSSEAGAWDIYPMLGNKKVFFYSWITEEELALFATPGGEAMIRQRLESLEFNYEEFRLKAEKLDLSNGFRSSKSDGQKYNSGIHAVAEANSEEVMQTATEATSEQSGNASKEASELQANGARKPSRHLSASLGMAIVATRSLRCDDKDAEEELVSATERPSGVRWEQDVDQCSRSRVSRQTKFMEEHV